MALHPFQKPCTWPPATPFTPILRPITFTKVKVIVFIQLFIFLDCTADSSPESLYPRVRQEFPWGLALSALVFVFFSRIEMWSRSRWYKCYRVRRFKSVFWTLICPITHTTPKQTTTTIPLIEQQSLLLLFFFSLSFFYLFILNFISNFISGF